jgi:tight adherence protein C
VDYFTYIVGILRAASEALGVEGDVFVFLVAGSAFVAGLALVLLVDWVTSPFRARLRRISGASEGAGAAGQTVGQLLGPLAAYALPREAAARTRTQARLIQAGYRSPHAVGAYHGLRLLMTLLLPGSVLLAAPFWPSLGLHLVVMLALFATGIGYVLPGSVLDRSVRHRQKRLRRGVPDALDLLVVCTEAGLGLKAAIQRVADDIAVSHPDLADELSIVNLQTRAGVDNVTALRDLADRTGLQDLRGLVAALGQSLRFGTSLAETLRIYSEEMRDKRMQRAEEVAASIGTKMIFPLALCLFPAIFVVMVAPAVLGALAALRGSPL